LCLDFGIEGDAAGESGIGSLEAADFLARLEARLSMIELTGNLDNKLER